MRGSAAFRAAVAPGGVLAGPWVRNALWRSARAVPSLDLRFAENKSLADAVTGQSLVTFTRASSGTYVGSDGLIKTATTNLLLRSEEFETTWFNNDSSEQTNVTASPNGTLTADKLVEGTGINQKNLEQSFTYAALQYTASVYAKASERSIVYIAENSTGSARRAYFNLSTGAVGTVSAGHSASIVSVGNGWYRCITTFTANAASSFIRIGCTTTDGAVDYTGNGTSGLFLWGAQLEQSSTVGEYIPTTSTINSAPRFDHNPTTGESLGLLVEEQRTNLVLNSATFQPTSGSAPASYTVDQVAPDGTTTGSRQTAATPRTLIDYTGIANALYTFSFYCRVTSGTAAFSIQLKNAVTDTIIVSDTSPVATTAWRRFSISGTTTGATTGARIELTGIVPGFVLWGAQLEAGAFPTSYIPTTTATVTRNADVASITGANFSSWYRQDEGTVFADAQRSTLIASTQFSNLWSTSDNTANERFIVYNTGSSQTIDAAVTDGGVSQAVLLAPGAITANNSIKTVLAYRANDFALTRNAGIVQSDTIGTLPTVDRIYIGANSTGAGQWTGTIGRLVFWPQRLPNSTLEAVTQ